jgi:dethiobiotin synthetase
MKRYFITSTGTGIGKTFFTASLLQRYTRGGYTVRPLKPVISGFSWDDPCTDSAILARASGISVNEKTIQAISPWRFALPASPHFAARAEGIKLQFSDVVNACNSYSTDVDIMLIEGAGGVMAPLTESNTMLDLMRALNVPIILVVGSYLGSISHTLTALHVLNGTSLHSVVVMESAEQCAGLSETQEAILQFAPIPVPVYAVPRAHQKVDAWKFAKLPDVLCQSLI